MFSIIKLVKIFGLFNIKVISKNRNLPFFIKINKQCEQSLSNTVRRAIQLLIYGCSMSCFFTICQKFKLLQIVFLKTYVKNTKYIVPPPKKLKLCKFYKYYFQYRINYSSSK